MLIVDIQFIVTQILLSMTILKKDNDTIELLNVVFMYFLVFSSYLENISVYWYSLS
jgi:hypothetical protein